MRQVAVQFLVLAYDGTDAEAPARRQAARQAHLDAARALKASGNFIEGGAILDNAGKMIGSALIMNFPSEADLNAWLQSDPYVIGDVWKDIKTMPFRCAPI